MKICLPLTIIIQCLLAAESARPAVPNPDVLDISSTLMIPGATLHTGHYTFELEDRLPDRAIVRITENSKSDHLLILAVPSHHLSSSDSNTFTYFSSQTNTKALRSWKCQTCEVPLEMVYPKLEAISLMGSGAGPVLAMDPAYDKLPSNLSPDDMKVVTLWLVAPEAITPDGRHRGVKATKLSEFRPAETANTLRDANRTGGGRPKGIGSRTSSQLPHTASNTYELLGSGSILLCAAAVLRIRRAVVCK